MENASKALIIAGAILISILLISVGIIVMNSTSGVTDQVEGQMDSLGVQQFNSRFDGYIGNNKSANDVKSLVSAVIASNGATGTTVSVKFLGTTTINGTNTAKLGQIQAAVDNKVKYSIFVKSTYTDAANNGKYKEIDVQPQ